MKQRAFAAMVWAAVMACGITASAPLHAQNPADQATKPPSAPLPGRVITSPAFPYPVYVVPVLPRDDRTPRQRCWDTESARIGGTLSDLDRRAIDLKCSQR